MALGQHQRRIGQLKPRAAGEQRLEVHPGLVTQWKRVAVEGLPELFAKPRKKDDSEALATRLYEEIGRETRWYEWRDQTTRLRFIDNGHTYALVYEDLATVANLSALRPVAPRQRNQGHALVDAVTVDPDAEVRDPHADVADRISGTQRAQ